MANNKEDVIVPEFERPLIELESKITELKTDSNSSDPAIASQIKSLEQDAEILKQKIFSSLTPYQRVLIARHPKRPYSLDYINELFTDFIELHGDRGFADDKAVVTGMCFFEQIPVIVIGQQKGRSINENLSRNFGMMHPEGYRKALRIMKLAEKFNKPLLVFIDTPGAYPGIGAEERGQGEAIARNLKEMANLNVPIIGIVVGEGCSGGALGIGVSDKIIMLENSYYSVISPEGYSAILFHDANHAAEAAAVAKIMAQDLFNYGIIDEIIPEQLGGCHRNFQQVIGKLRQSIQKNLTELKKLSSKQLLELRYKKYRKIGEYEKSNRTAVRRA